jgi:hypothetical protein
VKISAGPLPIFKKRARERERERHPKWTRRGGREEGLSRVCGVVYCGVGETRRAPLIRISNCSKTFLFFSLQAAWARRSAWSSNTPSPPRAVPRPSPSPTRLEQTTGFSFCVDLCSNHFRRFAWEGWVALGERVATPLNRHPLGLSVRHKAWSSLPTNPLLQVKVSEVNLKDTVAHAAIIERE